MLPAVVLVHCGELARAVALRKHRAAPRGARRGAHLVCMHAATVLVRLPNSPRPSKLSKHVHCRPYSPHAQQQKSAVPPRAASQRQHPERVRCSVADSLPLARLRGLSAFIARAACLHSRPAFAAIKRERPRRPGPASPRPPQRKPTSRRLSTRAVAHARQAPHAKRVKMHCVPLQKPLAPRRCKPERRCAWHGSRHGAS